MEKTAKDRINPDYYKNHPSGVECIDITRHYCFSIGNAIKYLWRAGLKTEEGLDNKEKEIEDLKKATWYINDRIKQLGGKENIKNKKLRLLVTAFCPNKCPMCCNNSWDFSKLPIVDRWDYNEIMITGGEPLCFSVKVSNLLYSIRQVLEVEQKHPKIYLYTSNAEKNTWAQVLEYLDGIVYTPHKIGDIDSFITLNQWLLVNKSYYSKISFRLNLFEDIEKLLPKDIDLSLWKVKHMEWIKDCPVPEGEDFRRIAELYE